MVGAGPAGIAGALALTHVGAKVALAGPPPPKVQIARPETRTAALLTSSVDFLKRLGVWEAIAPVAAPLKAVRIVDASSSLLRSPDITFAASELGLEAFGYNIANTTLSEVLYARAQEVVQHLTTDNVEAITIDERSAKLSLGDGSSIDAQLIAGADGRGSKCREAAQIQTDQRRYGQSAIATSFRHSVPHEGVSSELHREGGSLTTVPTVDAQTSSLIWVGETDEIEVLMSVDEEEFAGRLQDRLGETLGAISDVGPRASFPVAGLKAKPLAANRTALVGDAAHGMPPIGAQGLNLGLRDAAALADCVGDALRHGRDAGSPLVLNNYIRVRELDVLSRSLGVDLLNRSLLTGLLPVRAARGVVLTGLNAIGPLKRFVMRAGLAPPAALPRLMRPVEKISA